MKKVYLKTPEAVIKALKEGKEVRDDIDCVYKIIDGFIVSEGEGKCKGEYLVGDCISSGCRPYIIEKEPLKFKVGGFYETRNHKKARCFCVTNQACNCSFTIDNEHVFYTDKNGNQNLLGKESCLDIIGPWKEDKK